MDNALRLLQLLRDLGAVRLKDAAAELKVAPSTAHRLLAMLVYHGFALQDESKRYLPGPALGAGPVGASWTTELRTIAQPHLELLAMRLNEPVNLMVRAGTQVRFLSTVEGAGILRVGDRRGAVLPARRASGGKAILAELPTPVLDQLYRSHSAEAAGDALSDREYEGFLGQLRTVRANGFAANFEGTEEGVSALGVAIRNGAGRVLGACSVATPATRFRKVYDAGLVAEVFRTKAELEMDLAGFLPEAEGAAG